MGPGAQAKGAIRSKPQRPNLLLGAPCATRVAVITNAPNATVNGAMAKSASQSFSRPLYFARPTGALAVRRRQHASSAACAAPEVAPCATAGTLGATLGITVPVEKDTHAPIPEARILRRQLLHPLDHRRIVSPPCGCNTSTPIAPPRTACRLAAPRDHAPGHTPLAAGEPALSPFFCRDFLHHLELEIALCHQLLSAVHSPPQVAAGA